MLEVTADLPSECVGTSLATECSPSISINASEFRKARIGPAFNSVRASKFSHEPAEQSFIRRLVPGKVIDAEFDINAGFAGGRTRAGRRSGRVVPDRVSDPDVVREIPSKRKTALAEAVARKNC